MLTKQRLETLIDSLHKGQHLKVIAEAGKLIRSNPKVPGLYELLGTAHAREGNFDKAERSFQRALKLMPGLTSARFNLGELYLSAKRFPQAVACFEMLTQTNPDDGRILLKLADALVKRGLPDQAVPHLEHAAALSATAIAPRFQLGQIARNSGDDDAALGFFQTVLEIDPAHYEARFNIGNIHRDARRNDTALACYTELLQERPNHIRLLLNIHACHMQNMDFEKARAANDAALVIDPENINAAFNRSAMALMKGKWHEGYALAEHRFQTDKPVMPLYQGREPHWDGVISVADGRPGRLVLHAEQGLGDTIMMLRFLRLIEGAAPKPVVLVHSALERLVALSFPGFEVASFGEHERGWRKGRERAEAQCSVLSLPHLLADRWQDIPSPGGYLSPPEDVAEQWSGWLCQQTDRPAVGIVWRGNPANPNDRHRSIELDMLVDHLPDAFCYAVLQKDITDDERGRLDRQARFPVLYPSLTDMADTAALCQRLHAVIAVDTSVAHLAGALGTTTHLLLPFMPDPRWREAGDACDWYDSMVLYRQTTTGDWTAPLTRLEQALL